MKKASLMALALVAMTAGLSASDAAATAAAPKTEAKASPEQDFVAKLNEKNQKAFNGMTAEQKKAAMAMASCDGAACANKKAVSANEAVEKVLAPASAQTAQAPAAQKAQAK